MNRISISRFSKKNYHMRLIFHFKFSNYSYRMEYLAEFWAEFLTFLNSQRLTLHFFRIKCTVSNKTRMMREWGGSGHWSLSIKLVLQSYCELFSGKWKRTDFLLKISLFYLYESILSRTQLVVWWCVALIWMGYNSYNIHVEFNEKE